MPKPKYDGVVEAVRYATDGNILLVRVYERRGATFSDRILLDRKALLERLKKNKRFVTGRRMKFLASTFEVEQGISCQWRDGKEIITTQDTITKKDALAEVPIF